MKKCKFCKKSILKPENKFCNSSCAAKFNNKGRIFSVERKNSIHTGLVKFYSSGKGSELAKVYGKLKQGWRHSSISKKKISDAVKARSPEIRMRAAAKLRGRPLSKETKQKISLKASARGGGGRCKWYNVAGQKVQGTWERNIALVFEKLNIHWEKLKTNKHTLEYIVDNRIRNYTPDFYLKDYALFLEVKGFWWGDDKRKMEIIFKTYPNINLRIIEEKEYNRIMQGELVW